MLSQKISDENKFGVTLLLYDCAFSAEVRRDALTEILDDIDNQLTESGAPSDSETRVELVMNSVSQVSSMVAAQEIGHDEGVTDIAYSFIYCLGKSVGFDQVVTLRGLTGSYLRNVLSLNPCLGELEYRQEMATLQRAMDDCQDGEWSLDSIPVPTVH
jgi:hypothetical protein